MLYLFISFLTSLAVTFIGMPLLLRLCKVRGLYDMPNDRKIHQNKVPRLGGVFFAPAMIIGLIMAFLVMLVSGDHFPTFSAQVFFVSAGLFLIYLIGLLDDVLGLNARLKFIVQFVSALFLPICGVCLNNLYGLFGIHELPLWAGYPLTVFIALLVINAINLIDGIDGLSSSLSLLALMVFTLLNYRIGGIMSAILAAGLTGTVLAFLYFNMLGKVERNTKTFMGDTGSLILGYALAFFVIKYAMFDPTINNKPEPLLTSFTLLIVPTFDLVRVAFSRLRHGVSIFHADKTHIHHKFLAVGLSMHRSLAVILLLQLTFIGLNWLLFALNVSTVFIVIIDILLFATVHAGLNRKIKNLSLSNGTA